MNPSQEITQPVEIKIILKNEEKRATYSHLDYRLLTAHPEDPIIKEYLEKDIENFGGNVDSIKLKLDILMS